MIQSGHLNPSEETGTGWPVTSKYGRTPPNKHGGVGRQQPKVTKVRYAYDTLILSETEYELHHLMDIVVQESEQKRVFLNIDKSYTMVFSESSSIPTCLIKVHGKPLEQMNSFVYLQCVFTSDSRFEREVKRRIGIAMTAFTYMEKVLCGRNISMLV